MTAADGRCSNCGGPLGLGNSTGICAATPACRSAVAALREKNKRNDPLLERGGAPRNPPSPIAVMSGCLLGIRECLVDLRKYADRGIDQIDAIREGVLDARKVKPRTDETGEHG